MTQESTAASKPVSDSDTDGNEKPQSSWFKQQWSDNHGNFLIAFAIGTVVANVAYVAYQQSKFVPLKFPDERAFRDINGQEASIALPAAESVSFRVIGAPVVSGSIVLAVYDSAESVGNSALAVKKWKLPLKDGVAFRSVDPNELPSAFSAIAFHDDNDDGQLTQNKRGVPIERYGYTGDQRYLSPDEPPSYEQMVIDRPEPGSEVEIFIR
jgi:uncharacterized protein (DUF2141 family)